MLTKQALGRNFSWGRVLRSGGRVLRGSGGRVLRGAEFSAGPTSPWGRVLAWAEFSVGPSSRVLRYSSAAVAHHACRSVCCILE